ncbi:hypothetical protein BKA70DRAFT_508618 [Coprinopsis sp. MPI-PUGE-AT-0042]|nr:hypothetical protein BKA70DRAFT_508618 [Coprinopsis sp. MPI-PUGE-AT-0042]
MSLANPTGEETETLPLSLLWEATQFARELFDAKMQGATFPGAGWSKPENLTPRNCFDLVHGVSVIVQATSNPYKMGWSLDEYTEAMRSRPKGKSADAEKALLDKFPPRCLPGGHPLPMEIRASVVTSNEGDVLLWYLPNLLSPSAMGDLTAAIGAFVATKNSVNVSSKGSSWRAKGGAFRDTTECNMIPGLTYFSPAWYATGHEVRVKV